MTRLACAGAAVALLVSASSMAQAKSTKELTYAYGVVWSTAIRLIRVDRGYKVTDKDRENGYILFVYPGGREGKDSSASMEIVIFSDEKGRECIRVQLGIAGQPSYVEVHMLDALEQKLQEEQGLPPEPGARKKKDGEGKGGGKGKGKGKGKGDE